MRLLTHTHTSHTTKNNKICRLTPLGESFSFGGVEHGSNNVSRWMTWLPISLKNAAKCDKWYQLQNHSITESLNAKGAWEKLFTSHPRACRISVSNNKQKEKTRWGVTPLLCPFSFLKKQTKRESGAWLKISKRTTLVLWPFFFLLHGRKNMVDGNSLFLSPD